MIRLNISISKETYERLRKDSFELKISMSQYIRNLLEEKHDRK